MKIGIVVYSQTGNTLSVSERIATALRSSGNTATIERITTLGSPNSADRANVQLAATPEISGYDALIFASPVHGFSLSVPMAKYVEKLPALEGRTACVFVTEQFPFPWLGGNRALAQLEAALKAKGSATYKLGVINWGSKRREEQIKAAVESAASRLLS